MIISKYLKLNYLLLFIIMLFHINLVQAGTKSIKSINESSEEAQRRPSHLPHKFLTKKKSVQPRSVAETLPIDLWRIITGYASRHPMGFHIIARLNRNLHARMWENYYNSKNRNDDYTLPPPALLRPTHNQQHSYITALTVIGETLDSDQCLALKSFQLLTELTLKCNLHNLEELPKVLQVLPKLQRLSLSKCGLVDNDLKVLAPTFFPLITLDLSNNPLTDRGFSSLSTSLIHLQELKIWEPQVFRLYGFKDSYELKGFPALLNSLTALEKLDLSILTNEGVWALRKVTSLSQLESFRVSRVESRVDSIEELGEDEIKVLLKFITKLKKLESLTLIDMPEISNAYASAIAKSLTKLRNLDLRTINTFGKFSGNTLKLREKIGLAGILDIVKLAKLTSLALPFNNIGNHELEEIVKSCPNLEQLNVMCSVKYDSVHHTFHFISKPGVMAIAKLTNLMTLALPGHALTDGDLRTISHSLTGLQSLYFMSYRSAMSQQLEALVPKPTKISVNGLKEIHNLPHLLKLRLEHNQIANLPTGEVDKFLDTYEQRNGHQLQLLLGAPPRYETIQSHNVPLPWPYI